MTNSQKLRAMSDEQLADWLKYDRISVCPPDTGHIHCNISDICADRKCWLDWLKQEIPAPPQKAPLCLSCKHGENGCVDDFATCYCPHHGYVGQKTECGEYDAKEVLDNG